MSKNVLTRIGQFFRSCKTETAKRIAKLSPPNEITQEQLAHNRIADEIRNANLGNGPVTAAERDVVDTLAHNTIGTLSGVDKLHVAADIIARVGGGSESAIQTPHGLLAEKLLNNVLHQAYGENDICFLDHFYNPPKRRAVKAKAAAKSANSTQTCG